MADPNREIDPILDPNIRTAKVRLEVPNPARLMRVGMFATATFYGRHAEIRAEVPTTAVLHLHDRDWVFVPAGGNQFKRVEVSAGNMLPGNKQQILSGVAPGQQVVANVLALEESLEAR